MRYEGEEDWPAIARTYVDRLHQENAALLEQLALGPPRPTRYDPDYSRIDGSHVSFQWKGTDVCLDFRCECGAEGHFDGYFAYAVTCGECGRSWALPHSVTVIPLPVGSPLPAVPIEREDHQ